MGIEIGVNYSWFIIFGLVTVVLAVAYFPQQYPGLERITYVVLGLITSIFFFVSVLLHELSHSLVARLNKIPISSITLFIFGGVSNMSKEPESPRSEFAMAVAGPLASFLLALLFGGVALGAAAAGFGVLVVGPARYLAFINVALGAFNLVPGFPLDGGRVLRSILWGALKDLRKATHVVSIMGQGFAALLILFGLYLLFLSPSLWPNGLWFIFIGWFLYQLAGSSYQEVLLRSALGGVRASDIMTKNVATIFGSLTVDEAINDYFMVYKHGRFPVTDDGGAIIGIVSLNQIRDVPREERLVTRVRDVTPPLTGADTITPDAAAEDVLIKMAQARTGHILVMDDARLDGIITNRDIMHLIQMRTRLGA